MEKLRTYLNGLTKQERARYVAACGTTEGYLRKAVSINQQIGADLCIALERESSGAVPCESLRPDVDWAYIRASSNVPHENASAVGITALSAELSRAAITREHLLQLPPSAEAQPTSSDQESTCTPG